MQLDRYLERIGYSGKIAPDLDTLIGVHRCHAFTIPYENLDVQLGRPLNFDIERIFDKMVIRHRGGWCYEIHTLLNWVLTEIGFDVSLVTSGIERDEFGDEMLGNHIAVLVHLDQTYLADLGLGDGLRQPIPLQEGTYNQGELEFRLEKIEGGYWRFLNHATAVPGNFDFKNEPCNMTLVEKQNHYLQTNSESEFVKNFVCQIMRPNSVTCLTGRVLREKTRHGTTKEVISEDKFHKTLVDIFGINDVEAVSIWPKIVERHSLLFGEKSAEEIDFQGF